jgi:hypothetical protein
MRRWRAFAGWGLAALTAPAAAHARPAGWMACEVEAGVLVAPAARLGGLVGPFIIDVGQAQSQLDATQASLAGLAAGTARARLRLGALTRDLDVSVAPLDERTRLFATPITGVLGADAFSGEVLDVQPDPCRMRISRAPPPAGRPLASLAIVSRGGVPHVLAGVSDGLTSERGLFRIATGGDLAVRLDPGGAGIEADGASAHPATVAPLRALSIGAMLVENPRAGLAAASEPGAMGEIGEPLWSRYGFRLDFRSARLTLYPPAKKARRSGP